MKEIYDNLEIQRNEDGIEELGFRDKNIAEKFINGASRLWPLWISNEDKLTMQFIADVIKRMSDKNMINKQDLYILSEKEVIGKIENCKDENISKCFKLFRNSTKINESDSFIENKYCVSIKTKRRYINPLVKNTNEYKRISDVSPKAQEQIKDYLNYDTKKYAYLDFNF